MCDTQTIIRKCSICKIEKELISENYHKDKSRNLGFMYNCKTCEKERHLQKYIKNPRSDRYKDLTIEQKANRLDWAKKYRKTPKGQAISILAAYSKFDSNRGFLFNLDQEYFISEIKKGCFYCSFPATGFDRILNNKGHSKDNVVPCCKECNVARMNNFTHEETIILGEAINKIKSMRI